MRATVFLFLATDCPISNRYAPELQRLDKQFRGDGVQFYLVYVDPGLPAEELLKHQKEYQLPGTIALDPKHALIEAARIKVTPETAVFDRTGRLVYHGRIDDRYPALGQVRRRVQKHELADTLASLVGERPVTTSPQPAVGCPIPPRS